MKISELIDSSFFEAGNELVGDAQIIGASAIDFTKAKNCKIIFGSNVKLKKISLTISGSSVIKIGDESNFYGRLVAVQDSIIEIGNKVKFNAISRIHAAEGKGVYIGDGCLLSNVRFRTSDSHSVIDLNSKMRINPAKDIVIEKNVWIAEEVYIYKGAHVGAGSIVGAHSKVYSASFEANSLIVGAPAKTIKSNISWVDNLI